MTDRLHIVCLDAPAPPSYGGAIDMYWKIVALAEAGNGIVLHYFDYRAGRGVQGLEKYCAAIHAYERKSFAGGLASGLPYIVRSRINKELIGRLNADGAPILLEGLHCSGILPWIKDRQRVIVRMHNEEAAYYDRLRATERSPLKRAYLSYESRLLKNYYAALPKDLSLACLAETDMDVLRHRYGFHDLHFIPCFIPWQEPQMELGRGDYCLYHGNLSVPENEAAAEWLIKQVWPALNIPLVIAGSGPSPRLQALCAAHSYVRLEADPSLARIGELVRGAQLHVLPSLNSTGVKLKLLHALFGGRHCLTNRAGIEGSAIDAGVHVAEQPGDWVEAISDLYERPFTEEDKKNRGQLLAVYDNRINAVRLSARWSRYR